MAENWSLMLAEGVQVVHCVLLLYVGQRHLVQSVDMLKVVLPPMPCCVKIIGDNAKLRVDAWPGQTQTP